MAEGKVVASWLLKVVARTETEDPEIPTNEELQDEVKAALDEPDVHLTFSVEAERTDK